MGNQALTLLIYTKHFLFNPIINHLKYEMY